MPAHAHGNNKANSKAIMAVEYASELSNGQRGPEFQLEPSFGYIADKYFCHNKAATITVRMVAATLAR